MTYDDALAFWYGRINYEVKAATPADLKLERMRAFLARLGAPQDRLRVVHITGTKGKGSTAAVLAAVLRAAGYRVGLFTSPHLVRVEERIRIDGDPITPAELAALVADVAPAVRELEAGPGQGPTFFEIGTALGFLHFVRRRADVAVVEVGLGGRFDSTNVCTPLVSVVTSVGLDHTAQLGTTPEAIAYQKAGIIKRGVPVVSGVTPAGPRAVVEREAAAAGSRLYVIGEDFGYDYWLEGPDRAPHVTISTPHGAYPACRLGLLGEHQGMNAAVAVTAIDVLRAAGLTIPGAAVARGLREVRWPARVEVVGGRPVVVLDCAHNVPAVEALVATLRQTFSIRGTKSVVLAVSSDKQYGPMVGVLAGYFDHFHLTRYGHNPRCVPPDRLAELLTRTAPAARQTTHPDAAGAWAAARAAAGPDDLICVTGSVFLAGELDPLVRAQPT